MNFHVMKTCFFAFLAMWGATASAQVEIVASGLMSPRGIAIGPNNEIYVAEAGIGGDSLCFTHNENVESCYGTTGAITRISNGQQERIASGLHSKLNKGLGEVAGISDIAVRNNTIYVLYGMSGNPIELRTQTPLQGKIANDLGQIGSLNSGGTIQNLFDVSKYEGDNNPDAGEVDSNPYALTPYKDGWAAIDAGGNSLLYVNSAGAISTLAVFEDHDGAQSVPTSVAVGPDGALYVGELTGFPFPQGKSKIYRVVEGKEPVIFADGFTHIIDLAFGDEGSLYVLQYANDSLLSGNTAGSLIRLFPGGAKETILSTGLNNPTGLVIGNGEIYIANCGSCTEDGNVIRLTYDTGKSGLSEDLWKSYTK